MVFSPCFASPRVQGFFAPSAGLDAPLPCPDGTVSFSAAAAQCNACPANSVAVNGTQARAAVIAILLTLRRTDVSSGGGETDHALSFCFALVLLALRSVCAWLGTPARSSTAGRAPAPPAPRTSTALTRSRSARGVRRSPSPLPPPRPSGRARASLGSSASRARTGRSRSRASSALQVRRMSSIHNDAATQHNTNVLRVAGVCPVLSRPRRRPVPRRRRHLGQARLLARRPGQQRVP